MIFNITINDTEYELNFGMGFLRKVDKEIQMPVPNAPGVKKDAGIRFRIGALFDGDLESLEDILLVANEGRQPRLTRSILDKHIEDEGTDVDGLIDQVMDFLRVANVTKRLMRELEEVAKEQN